MYGYGSINVSTFLLPYFVPRMLNTGGAKHAGSNIAATNALLSVREAFLTLFRTQCLFD